MTPSPKGFSVAVLTSGLLAGSLDAVEASVQYIIKTGNNPGKSIPVYCQRCIGKSSSQSRSLCHGSLGAFIPYAYSLYVHFILFPVLSSNKNADKKQIHRRYSLCHLRMGGDEFTGRTLCIREKHFCKIP
jgi:hypothetical protein